VAIFSEEEDEEKKKRERETEPIKVLPRHKKKIQNDKTHLSDVSFAITPNTWVYYILFSIKFTK